MRLQQNQTWQQGDQYIRIVHVERKCVAYKQGRDRISPEGAIQGATKKDFCRLLKGATLLPPSRRIAPVEPAPVPAAGDQQA